MKIEKSLQTTTRTHIILEGSCHQKNEVRDKILIEITMKVLLKEERVEIVQQ